MYYLYVLLCRVLFLNIAGSILYFIVGNCIKGNKVLKADFKRKRLYKKISILLVYKLTIKY